MSDIVERLRDRNAIVLRGLFHAIPVMNEAADEIERLRAALHEATREATAEEIEALNAKEAAARERER